MSRGFLLLEAAKMLVNSARFLPQKLPIWAAKISKKEVIVLAAKNSVKRRFPVVGDEWALLGSGRTEKMRRLK